MQEGVFEWLELFESGIPIVNGSEVPFKQLKPISILYAIVSRKTLKGTPEGGYEPEQKMTREQALKSYTLDAAYGAFEEDIKGSISVGKLADFTIYNHDLMTVDESEILNTEIVMTIFDEQVVYEKKE